MTRYSFELTKEFDQMLQKLADDKGITKAELIRRALATYSFLYEEEKEGNKIAITDKKDELKKQLIML